MNAEALSTPAFKCHNTEINYTVYTLHTDGWFNIARCARERMSESVTDRDGRKFRDEFKSYSIAVKKAAQFAL